jgi:ABC-2 type transport system permease protein
MLTLLKKEINGFLSSITGYVVIGVFLLVSGLFLWVFPLDFNILNFGFAGLDGLFSFSPFIFLFLIPAVTMRSFADERKAGTLEFLLTKPLGDLEIIMAKYLASLLIVIIALLPTLLYVFTVYQLGMPKGNLDLGGTWGSYLGLLFLAASFVSIGIFCSTLTSNQIISFILALLVSAFFYAGFETIYTLDLFGPIDLIIKSMGIAEHYQSMSRGVLDSRDLIYFLSLIAAFILLTRLVLQSRKW